MAEGGGGEKANGSTAHVFISYASQDVAVANAVVDALERHGVECWIAPRDVVPGEFYAGAIVHAIDAAKVIVLVLSKSAAASQHVLREVERASSKRHPVIACRIDLAPLPADLEYFLNTSHWLDASDVGVERALPKLVDAVERTMAAEAAVLPGDTGVEVKAAARLTKPRPFSRRSHRLNRPVFALSVLIALGLGYLAANKLWFSKRTASERPVATVAPPATPVAPTVSEKSVAVLPFVDLSEKKDQEYFADGMTEEIINLLAQVPKLYIPARTSSFYFKGKSTRIPDIARELGVAHVLEGSVRKSGNRLRLTAQLIRAGNGYHVWSQTYNRDLVDVFKVQDEIANAVVQALQISLMGGPLTRQRGGTQNLEAYQLYLRAGDSTNQNSMASLEEARTDLEHATKLDPTFGLAWCSLAMHYAVAAENGLIPPQEGFERARRLVQQALQLSPDVSDAHAILSYVKSSYDWDWPGAETEARRALVLDPTNTRAIAFSGALYMTLGRWADADRQLRLALARDPLSPWRNLNLGIELYSAGRYAEAETSFRRVLNLAPAFISGHYYLGKALLAEERAQEALTITQQEVDEGNRLNLLPIVLQAVGRKPDADEALHVLSTKFADDAAFNVAMVYAYRGDRDKALQWLDRAYRQKDLGLVEIVGEPLLKNLADDPRYKAFLRKMNLPD